MTFFLKSTILLFTLLSPIATPIARRIATKSLRGPVEQDQEWIRLQEIETNSIYGSQTDANVAKVGYTPIVFWHGMGDTAWNMKRVFSFIQDELPGVYTHALQIGNNIAEDIRSGYLVNVNDQVELVCDMIKGDSNLSEGYNAIGLSQGGQFLRAVAQRCPNPPMLNLISLGGQHQGIFGLPKCSASKQKWCELVDKLLTHAAYESWVQNFLVQAEYWNDPFKNEEYIQNSVFLADINNERNLNTTYKENLLKLKNMVLVKFQDDTIVQPKESEWFGYYEIGQDKTMVPLEESVLYKEDRLGLKEMNENGKLHLLACPGDHLQFTKPWFIKNILLPFLK